MTRNPQQPSGLNQGNHVLINAEWTPQQASAVFELLDDLRECIWNRYAYEIREIIRDQRGPDPHQDEANSIDPTS